jgi:hypothetical protein
MRIPMNTISPLTLFWRVIYVLALFSVFIAGILARNQDSKKGPRKNQSEAANQKPLWIQPSTTTGRTPDRSNRPSRWMPIHGIINQLKS